MRPTMQDLKQLVTEGRLMFDSNQVIISGGAPRDVLNGACVKDIDMFVYCDSSDEQARERFQFGTEKLASYLNGQAAYLVARDDAVYADLAYLAQISLPDGKGIIEVCGVWDDPVDDVANYDFSLSQVFVTPKSFFLTGDAMNSRELRYIRYMGSRTDAAMNGSKHRLARLRAKYPGWDFENCEALDAMPERPLGVRTFKPLLEAM